ncbi:MAG: preprotein translocase subunit SecE [Alphaproteobacteria bacterium]
MAELNPAKFIREVRQEVKKVVWPTRRETFVSTALVMGLAFIASVFFLLVDGATSQVISAILGLGTGNGDGGA